MFVPSPLLVYNMANLKNCDLMGEGGLILTTDPEELLLRDEILW